MAAAAVGKRIPLNRYRPAIYHPQTFILFSDLTQCDPVGWITVLQCTRRVWNAAEVTPCLLRPRVAFTLWPMHSQRFPELIQFSSFMLTLRLRKLPGDASSALPAGLTFRSPCRAGQRRRCRAPHAEPASEAPSVQPGRALPGLCKARAGAPCNRHCRFFYLG